MPCPFLKQGLARYCHTAPIRKLILEGPGATGEGRCASPDYRQCELVRNEEPPGSHCPHLEEIHVQYCGASPVTKLVPFSDSQMSHCAHSGYRYCDTYLSLARPNPATPPPPDLLLSSNHFWLEPEESSLCHIGIDAFLAEVLGRVDGVTFVTTRGTHRPTVTLTVHGVEWPMVFPNALLIERVNRRLRMDPARLTADPYGVGWLFEGWELPGKTRSGLIGGAQAAAWQAEERERLAREIHETQEIGADGGYAQPGVAQLLSRQSLVGLCQKFFSRGDLGQGGLTMARGVMVFGLGVATALAAGWFAFSLALYSRGEQPVGFHHKAHAEKSGTAQCADCHAFREDGTFAGIPRTETCAACHAERVGTSKAEAVLVDSYIKQGKETPWREIYRQPANVWFSHTVHTRLAKLTCQECHGAYGDTNDMPPYERNRLSGYSRKAMDMDACEDCHRKRGIEVGCLGCHE